MLYTTIWMAPLGQVLPLQRELNLLDSKRGDLLATSETHAFKLCKMILLTLNPLKLNQMKGGIECFFFSKK